VCGRSTDDYRCTALTGANTAGDSNSIACVADTVRGACNGLEVVPLSWRENAEDAGYFHAIESKLAASAARRDSP
jgi:ADP-ribosylglycohydrolase